MKPSYDIDGWFLATEMSNLKKKITKDNIKDKLLEM